jgi:CMP-N-acetylneuraminic acid synthetase
MPQSFLIKLNRVYLKSRSQDLSKTFYDTGTFGVFSSKVFYKKRKINYSGYAIPRYKGIDVDTYEDWDLLTKIIKKK